MRVSIEDKEALGALSWKSLKVYLDAAGWRHADDMPGKAEIYQIKDKKGRLREILVPLRDDFADYASRMGDAVATLGRVEDRSELDIYNDLRAPDAAREVHERIRRWLAEEGWQVETVNESSDVFDVMVTLQSGYVVQIYQRIDWADHIAIHTRISLDDAAKLEVYQLTDSVRREIFWEIYRDMALMGVEFSTAESSLDEMRFYEVVYFDALTKDCLIQRVRLLLRAMTLSIHTLVRSLREAGRPSDAASNLLHLIPSTGGPLTAVS